MERMAESPSLGINDELCIFYFAEYGHSRREESENEEAESTGDPEDFDNFKNLSLPLSYFLMNKQRPSQHQQSTSLLSLAGGKKKYPSTLIYNNTRHNVQYSDVDVNAAEYYPCYACDKIYKRKESLNRHRKGGTCLGVSISICGICDQKFSNRQDMMKHREEHFRDKPTSN